MKDKIWTAEEAAKITDLDMELVRRRAQRLGIVGKRGGNHRHGALLLYSDEDLERIKDSRRKLAKRWLARV